MMKGQSWGAFVCKVQVKVRIRAQKKSGVHLARQTFNSLFKP